ncbi:TolC family protein, partial [Ralstonia pseudosolanacearum]
MVTHPCIRAAVALSCALLVRSGLAAAPAGEAAATSDTAAPAAQSAPASVPGAAHERMTLQQAIDRALATHPALAAAGYAVRASEGAVDQASRLRNPEAAFLTEDVRRDRATMTAQLNIPLELGGKRAARTRAAELARDAAGQDAAVLAAELRADVTRAFFELSIAQERLRLAQASDALAAQAEAAAVRRVQAGKVSPVEQTKAAV